MAQRYEIISHIRKIITNFVKQFNYGAAIPSIGSKADQWISLPKSL